MKKPSFFICLLCASLGLGFTWITMTFARLAQADHKVSLTVLSGIVAACFITVACLEIARICGGYKRERTG